MPTKIVVNCATGEQEEIEMEGDELAAHAAQLATPEPELVSLKDQILAELAAELEKERT